MDSIREDSLNLKNSEAKKLMVKFWETYDDIWDTLDELTYEEYKVKSKKMWSYRNEVVDVSGDIFLFTLHGLSLRVEERFENETKNEINDLFKK